MAREFTRHESHREYLEYNEKKRSVTKCYVKRICLEATLRAWYSIAPNVLEELYNSMPMRIADLIKAKKGATKYWLYDACVKICCCVFIGMNLSMLLCQWKNVFKVCCCVFVGMYLKYDVVFSLECIWYLNTKCCLIIRWYDLKKWIFIMNMIIKLHVW